MIKPTYKTVVGKMVAVKSLKSVLVVGDRVKLCGRDEPVKIIAVTGKGFSMEGFGFHDWTVRARPVTLLERPEGWSKSGDKSPHSKLVNGDDKVGSDHLSRRASPGESA